MLSVRSFRAFGRPYAKALFSTLPGRMGDPRMTLMTEPRMNQAMLNFFKPDLILGKYGPVGEALPSPVGPGAPRFLQHWWNSVIEKHLVPRMMPEEKTPRPDESTLANIEEYSESISGVDGNEVKLFIAKPKSGANGHCILHAHGGGMAVMSAAMPFYSAYRLSLASEGFAVVSVEFRNSSGSLGRHPYPAGLNDCMSALSWVSDNRVGSLGVTGSVVLNGESGGGNLCTAMAIRAKRDGRLGEIDGVFAMCPFIAGPDVWKAKSLPSLVECDGYFIDMKGFMMSGHLYDPERKHTRDPCAWPYFAELSDLEGLPPHVISVNELDPLRDEGLGYHEKLKAAGVRSQSVVIEGTFHGGDLFPAPGAEHIFKGTLGRLKAFCEELAGVEPPEAAKPA